MQNMILVVGPGTPASLLYTNASEDESDDNNDDDDDDDDDEVNDDESVGPVVVRSPEGWLLGGGDDHNDNDDDDDDGDVNRLDDSVRNDGQPREANADEEDHSSAEDSGSGAAGSSSTAGSNRPDRGGHMVLGHLEMPFLSRVWGRMLQRAAQRANRSTFSDSKHFPSIRHGGCINTASWLEAPWRLSHDSSNASVSAPFSRECPTQILTSGDDRVVKVWDVSGAMGMDHVSHGGWNTFCPFSSFGTADQDWRASLRAQTVGHSKPCGTVALLASLSTGHRGNVFHVTPLRSTPGSVLTCAADGDLRLCNLEARSSSVVVHPRDNDSFNSMAFSHVMVSTQTGLLCSERGLHLFDLRLPPRDQLRRSLVDCNPDASETIRRHGCKACAVWNPHAVPDEDRLDAESHYVFAGGSEATVSLFDLRMDGSRASVVERYKPINVKSGVSVSGLDVSRNARELLVSYESDQIYAFPIAHQSSRHPTVDELDQLCADHVEPEEALPELASYGGHLNRFTFLKNARYAGPNDEYICTGSDSGHAWIYHRCSGTVASLLGADSSTCNGVIPHPSLPFFITYGIDSTAKLWRATLPVDPRADDSPSGRYSHALKQPYEMSPVCQSWERVQALLNSMEEEPVALPDFIASPSEVQASGRFASSHRRHICSGTEDAPAYGNALEMLPSVLRQNRFECYKRFHDMLDVPVEHPLYLLTHRVSMSRLKHQADRLGLKWHPWRPWALEPRSANANVHAADMVPDYPSDWVDHDTKMHPHVLYPKLQFRKDETKQYGDEIMATHFPDFFYGEHYLCPEFSVPWLMPWAEQKCSNGIKEEQATFESRSQQLLYETVLLLKEGGNEAASKGFVDAAARRYDKAIQYCALAFMHYRDGKEGKDLHHLTQGHVESITETGGRKITRVISHWSPLLRVLITSRLNMALLFLKKGSLLPERAAGQARAALKVLAPFTVTRGKVIHRRDKKEVVLKDNEPESTFVDAQALQAKAYYRLGTAELESGDFASAIRMFDLSLQCASISSSKPDSLTLKRLQEAKWKYKESKKREKAT